jgi:flagellar protein FlaG
MDPVTQIQSTGRDVVVSGKTPQEGVTGESGVEQAPKRSTPEREDARPNEPEKVDFEKVAEEVKEKSNRLFKGTDLEFEFRQEENRIIVRVFDKESGNLLREIPPEEVVSLAKTTKAGKGRLFSRAV